MSYNASSIQAPPGGFNFAGGQSTTDSPDSSRITEEPPRVPPNTASSKFREEDTSLPTQRKTSVSERGTFLLPTPLTYSPALHPPATARLFYSDHASLVSPMDIARATVSAQKADPNHSTHPSRAAQKEADLVNSGKMPGLDKVQADNVRERQPGEEDAAGNRIHRKSLLGKLTHWEHSGMNE